MTNHQKLNDSTLLDNQNVVDGSVATHYHLDFKDYSQHLVQVQMRFTATYNQPVLWLPSWIPGSYLMREFSRHITAVQYAIEPSKQPEQDCGNKADAVEDNEPLEVSLLSYRAHKISKNEWQLTEVSQGDQVCVTYEVYCFDLSVRTAYVDGLRIFGNFTSLALDIEGQQQAVQVTLSVPAQFYQDKNESKVVLACGLPNTHWHSDEAHYYHLRAVSYEMLIDYPFELAEQTEGTFIVHDESQSSLVHRVFISGQHQTDIARLQQDLAAICQTYVSWLGDAPFADYTFMTYASGKDYGGLEHINSTSLITPRRDLPTEGEPTEPSTSYQRYLGLCSHEYFHAWWVKTVRPDVMMAVDLRREAYTPLLWVFEGFTSYIDDFMLQASGIISPKSYLSLLNEQINRYSRTPGRHYQSVSESSFDAWIKLYRADENTANAGVSYYNKGALVALCLDLLMLKHSEGRYRIFDVVKAFYQSAKDQDNRRIGMTSEYLNEIVSRFIDAQLWQDFITRYIEGVETLPIFELLESNGVAVDKATHDNTLLWGVHCEESPAGLQVTRVWRQGAAAAAGLSAKDIIVAINGIKADKAQLKYAIETSKDDITCHVFRRDELLVLTIPNSKQTPPNSKQTTITKTHSSDLHPSLDKVVLSLRKSGWERWLESPSQTEEGSRL